jgi:uncharacterized protein YacL
MKNFKPVDILILFIGVIIGIFILLSVISVLITHKPMDDLKARLIASIITSLVSVISLYVGHRLNGSNKDKKEKDV